MCVCVRKYIRITHMALQTLLVFSFCGCSFLESQGSVPAWDQSRDVRPSSSHAEIHDHHPVPYSFTTLLPFNQPMLTVENHKTFMAPRELVMSKILCQILICIKHTVSPPNKVIWYLILIILLKVHPHPVWESLLWNPRPISCMPFAAVQLRTRTLLLNSRPRARVLPKAHGLAHWMTAGTACHRAMPKWLIACYS